MLCSILLAISDSPCAQTAFRTLQATSAHPEGILLVLGVVNPFRAIRAHKHPLIGRRIRDLLWQSNWEQEAALEREVRQCSAAFEASAWDVRAEIREGPIAGEILACCRTTCPQLLIVGSCVRESLPRRCKPAAGSKRRKRFRARADETRYKRGAKATGMVTSVISRQRSNNPTHKERK